MTQNPIVTITMENGDCIKAELYPEVAPNSVNNFISLVKKGFYDGLIFHRVINGFMIQGGCPDGTGMGGPGYTIPGEFSQNGFKNDLRHTEGVLSMARAMHPDSAGSQFFIMHKNAPHLDGAYALSETYDGIILDIMMPKLSGLEVLQRLRAAGCRTPILLLTAKTEVEDRIQGLDAGADDYLPKPFAMGELLARIRAMLRRREEFSPDILRCKDLSLNTASYELSGPTGSVVLPRLEYQLIELLIRNQGIYLSSADLLVKIWGYDTDAELGVVWVYISYLRKRLTAVGSSCAIRAKRNVGYTLEAKA